MQKRDHWVQCNTVTAGMTVGECSIEIQTAEGKNVSLFAPEDYVDRKNGWLRVNILESGSKSCLVYLPAEPFETGSRFVNIPVNKIK